MAPDNRSTDIRDLASASRAQHATLKATAQQEERNEIARHILTALLQESRGVPTLDAVSAFVVAASRRLHFLEDVWRDRRFLHFDEAARLACLVFWTPERLAAVSGGRGAKIAEILESWTERRAKGYGMNPPTGLIRDHLRVRDDHELRRAFDEAERTAERAALSAFEERRSALLYELGATSFEHALLLRGSSNDGVAELRRAYGPALKALAEHKLVPQRVIAQFRDTAINLEVDRLFADGVAGLEGVATPSLLRFGTMRGEMDRRSFPYGYTYLFPEGDLFDLTQAGGDHAALPTTESFWRFLEEVGIDPAAEAQEAWAGLVRQGTGDVISTFYRYAARPDGRVPILLVHPHLARGNKVALVEAANANDRAWIDKTWGEVDWDAEDPQPKVKPHEGDLNGVRVLMGAERHARYLALRAAATQGLEAFLDALAKDG